MIDDSFTARETVSQLVDVVALMFDVDRCVKGHV